MHQLLTLLRQADGALRDEAIVDAVVRPAVAIGPIEIGMPVDSLLAGIEAFRSEQPGADLELGDEHRVEVGYATDTVAHHLVRGTLPNMRLAWIEWASDARTGRLVVARFVLGESGFVKPDGVDALLAALRSALDAALGAGVARRSKHRRARCRPVDWTREGATLSLGAAAMPGDRWHSHTAVVLEAFDTRWPDPWARWTMFR